MPKQKAMGTPMARAMATKTTRKMMILLFPARISVGMKYQSVSATAPIRRAEITKSRRRDIFAA